MLHMYVQIETVIVPSATCSHHTCLLYACRIVRNLSFPVVWEDADMPEEWERDASMIPDSMKAGRYILWGWKDAATEQLSMPFNGTMADWPGLFNLSNNDFNTSMQPPRSMGLIFRDPSTYDLFKQGNAPFRAHLEAAGVAPTSRWPALLYGTLPSAWGEVQPDTNRSTFYNLEVM